ncbi:hypothetical protein EHS13_13530 [Paenibacillus psychroresistens]|uniref:Uncharacterized protein n=1 Tax=Paenibacillus psychroresistens TaxID=1778678 RepID=A0A6B8RJB4_9BACL|nr:hypothetical protein [Paenibacillus psychroresistens]QGQ95824.1 hypothetical protein EHS13_13530 [Paenibacillus psychroresistens]
MPKLLKSKTRNNTTIFEIDAKNYILKVRLVNQFRKSTTTIKGNINCIKMIDKVEKTSIEITSNSISFFPMTKTEDIEETRKVIYKQVAQRSLIYIMSSEDNLELSTSSLLSDDLRASASLLYYSLHKYITGQLYTFLNEKLNINDQNIFFDEVDHFTSEIFFNEIYKPSLTFEDLSNITLNKENYIKCLQNSKKKSSVNPFKLISLLLMNESSFYEEIAPYLKILYKEIFNEEYTVELDNIEKKITECLTKEKKNRTPEIEVCAAIAYAFKNIINSTDIHSKTMWSIYALSLRLYWLRQTADYDYDFEIKTSVREMSLLISSVKKFIKYINKQFTNNGDIDDEEISGDAINTKFNEVENHPKNADASNVDLDNTKLYNIDSKFLLDNIQNSEIIIFMTAVHLDAEFDFENILYSLNFTENITNKGKYFIYESDNSFQFSINIHIDLNGRWTIWQDEKSLYDNIYTQLDLIKVFDEFKYTFLNVYQECFTVKYFPELITSNPVILRNDYNIQTYNVSAIGDIQNSIYIRKNLILTSVIREIKTLFNLNFGHYNSFILEGFNVYIHLEFSHAVFSTSLPFYSSINKSAFEGNSNDIIMLIGVEHAREYYEDFEHHINNSMDIYDTLSVNANNKSALIDYTQPIVTEISNLDDFLNNKPSVLAREILDFFNHIAYSLIEKGNEFEKSNNIINVCIKSQYCGSFPHATLGMWYLRNTIIPIEISEEKGNEYYLVSIDLIESDHPEAIDELHQKYFYEMARFYLYRKNDYIQYLKYYDQGIDLGDTLSSYDELIKTNYDYQSLTINTEIAVTLEGNIKPNKIKTTRKKTIVSQKETTP